MNKKKNQLNEHSVEALREMAVTLGREIFMLRNELSLQRRLEKPHLLRAKKKERARVLTALTQKALSQDAEGRE